MKTKFTLLAIVAVTLSSPIQTLSQKLGTNRYLDAKRSFKEIILGNDIQTLGNKVDNYNKEGLEGTETYIVSDRALLSVGEDIEIDGIYLGTYKDAIVYISLHTDLANGTRLFKTFTQAYGRPYQANQFIEEFTWEGREVILTADLSGYEYATFVFFDRTLSAELDRANKEKASAAADDI